MYAQVNSLYSVLLVLSIQYITSGFFGGFFVVKIDARNTVFGLNSNLCVCVCESEQPQRM